MTTFFQTPRTTLPSPIVHAPTLIPPDPESQRVFHVPLPRVTPVQKPRMRFSHINEIIPQLCSDFPSHAPHIHHVSSLRVPNAPIPNMVPPTPSLPPQTFKPYSPQAQVHQKNPFCSGFPVLNKLMTWHTTISNDNKFQTFNAYET